MGTGRWGPEGWGGGQEHGLQERVPSPTPSPGVRGSGVPSVIGVMVTLLRQHASVIQVAATVTGPRR